MGSKSESNKNIGKVHTMFSPASLFITKTLQNATQNTHYTTPITQLTKKKKKYLLYIHINNVM
jgi:hypothetical protein